MDANQVSPKISVITATYNAAKYLPKLIESLQNQTDKVFEWVVADGGSTDETLQLLARVSDLTIKITSQPDFGIYDALNRGIKASTGDYYVVIGADDWFFSNAIHDYKVAITKDTDMITANIEQNNKQVSPLNKAPWLYGMRSYVSSHSVGTLFKKSLHDKLGYYSNQLPISADNLFILMAINQQVVLKKIDTVAGVFSLAGVSGTDVVGTLLDNFKVQIKMGSNKYIQIFLLLLRLLKHITRY